MKLDSSVRALVTGGAGFIGSHLVDALLARGAHVAVIDNFFLGKEENLAVARQAGDRFALFREDAAEFEALAATVDAFRPTVVYNLATKALGYSFFNPAGACRVNLDIALGLLELQRAGRYAKLVHLSSSEVYGTAQRVPMDEDHPLLAETTYAAGKAAADLAVASYVRMFELDAITVRPFNNYGPRQNDKALAAIVPLTFRRIAEGERPVIQGDGEQTRDLVFVLDTIDALLRLTEADVPRGSVLNVGSGQQTSMNTLVAAMAKELGYTGPIEHAPARVADVRRHCADVHRVEAIIGPVARTPLAEGLATTLAWYRAERERA